MAPEGSRTHSAAAAATTSIAEISNCCEASEALGRRIDTPRNTGCTPPKRQKPMNAPAASSTTTARPRSRPGGMPKTACTVPAPHTSAAAPTTTRPSVKPNALKTMAREIRPASSPAAPYSRMRTAPPVSTPRPMVLESA